MNSKDLVFSNVNILSRILYFCEDPKEVRRVSKSFYRSHKNSLTTYLSPFINNYPVLIYRYFSYIYGRIAYFQGDINQERDGRFYYYAKHRWNFLYEVMIMKQIGTVKKMFGLNWVQSNIIETLKSMSAVKVISRLDSKKYLWLFKNGVYDIKNKVFRDGLPSDYLSLDIRDRFGTSRIEQQNILDESIRVLRSLFFNAISDFDSFMLFLKKSATGHKNMRVLLIGEGNRLLKRIIIKVFERYCINNHNVFPKLKSISHEAPERLILCNFPIGSAHDHLPICILYENKFKYDYQSYGIPVIYTDKKWDTMGYKGKIDICVEGLRYILLTGG